MLEGSYNRANYPRGMGPYEIFLREIVPRNPEISTAILRNWKEVDCYHEHSDIGDTGGAGWSSQNKWAVVTRIGGGSFGSVYLHKCIEGKQKDELRAVKCIPLRKTKAGGVSEKIKLWSRELEAIFTFSKIEDEEVKNGGFQAYPL